MYFGTLIYFGSHCRSTQSTSVPKAAEVGKILFAKVPENRYNYTLLVIFSLKYLFQLRFNFTGRVTTNTHFLTPILGSIKSYLFSGATASQILPTSAASGAKVDVYFGTLMYFGTLVYSGTLLYEHFSTCLY